jgi:hypothetical protein
MWLIGTTWVTLKNGLLPADRRPRFSEFVTELFRLLLVFILFLAVVGGVFWAVRALLKSYTGFPGDFWQRYDVVYFLLTVIWVYLSCLAVQFVKGLMFRTLRLEWHQALIVGAVVMGFGWWIWWANYHGLRGEVWWFTLLILLVVLLRTVFVDYLGDIQVYMSENEIGTNWEVRRCILGDARAKLDYVLARELEDRKPYYDEVLIVGHSLGSVVAYDLLCRVLLPENGYSEAARRRIRHFCTVGSPLDKLWYFFRDRTHAQNPIFQGILGKLKGIKDAGNPDSPFVGLEWTNMWCATDVISGGLEEYGDLVRNIHLNSLLWPPFINHVRYWTSPGVMGRIGEIVFATTT